MTNPTQTPTPAPKGIIKNIKIKKFGIFDKFEDNNISFKERNIFYGWNYSGKTTISRVFSCLEHKRLHEDYQDAQFSFMLDNGNTLNESNMQGAEVRVFNSDYIKRNVVFDNREKGSTPIFILGETSKEKAEELQKINAKILHLDTTIPLSKQKRDLVSKKMSSFLTSKSKEIRTLLGLSQAFNATKLGEEIDQRKSLGEPELLGKILEENLLQEKLKQYAGSVEKDPVNTIGNGLFNKEDVEKYLSHFVTPSKTLKRLADKPDAEMWVREGMDLNKNSSICLFCGNTLSADLYKELDSHFSAEYESFRATIERAMGMIAECSIVAAPNKESLHIKHHKDYEVAKRDYDIAAGEAASFVKEVLEKLDNKLKHLTTSTPYEFTFDIEGFKQKEATLNNIIRENQATNSNIVSIKNSLQKEIMNSIICSAIVERSYKTETKYLSKSFTAIQNRESKKRQLESRRDEVKAEISNLHKGIESVNKLLKQYFGNTTDINIQASKDEQGNPTMLLKRGTEFAQNLSDGERTSIAFSHFLVSLEDQNSPNKSNCIIFIDDPISSLDSNHTHLTFIFIEALSQLCKQIFISTHNYEFFKLFARNHEWKNKFYITRKNGVSIIEDVPLILKDFRSEYNYLFYRIWNCQQKQIEEDLYILPNVMRRFLEMFSAFKLPNGRTLDERLTRILGHEIKSLHISSIVNEDSHSQPFTEFRNNEEVKNAVRDLLEIIKEADSQHYYCLECIAKNPQEQCKHKEAHNKCGQPASAARITVLS